jgi:mycothiol synthase
MKLPPEYTSRPPTVGDIEAVAALADVVSNRLIQRGAIESRDYLLNTWFGTQQDHTLSLEGKYLLVFAPDGALIAYLESENEPENDLFWFNLLLHPDHQSEALFHALREQAEAWGRAQVEPSLQGDYQFVTQAWAQDTTYDSYIKAAGYEVIRFWKRMDITLDAPPPVPELSNGFTIRPYQRGDDDHKIFEAWREAMAEDWGATTNLTFEDFMFYKVSRESEQDLSLWHFAMDGDEIAGFTIARWERAGDTDAGHIRDVGVRRAYRRKGLALALLHATFGEFYRQGKRRVSLGVDGMNANGANQLYERAGMTAMLTQYKYGKPIFRAKK